MGEELHDENITYRGKIILKALRIKQKRFMEENSVKLYNNQQPSA